MSRIGYFLLLVLAFGSDVASVQAQTVQPMPSSLTPEKMLAKEKAVEEHAAKRRACKSKAKEAGLNVATRGKFVRECMAVK
jgi:hypothetical protein